MQEQVLFSTFQQKQAHSGGAQEVILHSLKYTGIESTQILRISEGLNTKKDDNPRGCCIM